MRFLRQYLLATLLLGGLYLLTVRWVDPRGQFGGGRFPTVFLNARVIKQDLLRERQATAPVQAVIIGSSRSMLLPPARVEQVTGLRAFNLGVFAATADDYLALYRRATALTPALDLVILGVDPFTLVPGDRHPDLETDWALRSAIDSQATGLLHRLQHEVRVHKETLKFGYLADIGRSLWFARSPPEMRNRFEPDGRMTYPVADRAIAAGRYDFRAEQARCVPEQLAMLERSDSVSAARRALIVQTVREAAGAGHRVVVWLTPSHPDLLAAMTASPRATTQLGAVRDLVEELRGVAGISVFDLHDPVAAGLQPAGWYDCVHMSASDAGRVVELLLGREGTH